MAGIVGYIGKKKALPVLVRGLKALEHKGHDSAGVLVCGEDGITLVKQKGRVKELAGKVRGMKHSGRMGIGHIRWATHGVPSDKNAHPHHSCSKRIFVVHNGIIENYRELKDYLEKKNHKFVSETDTEIVAHLIEDFMKQGESFRNAIFDALKTVAGAYAFAFIDVENPDVIYAACLSSPLVVGVGRDENFLASNSSALVGLTKNVIYLNDGEVAEITKDSVSVVNLDEEQTPLKIEEIEWTFERAQKGNFPHFMLKEIFDGPEAVRAALRGRLKPADGLVKLGCLEEVANKLKNVKRVLIIACGTSYHAGLVGEYIFEEIAKLPTEVHFASEFLHREEPIQRGTIALVISRSGETADTLAALQKAKQKGLLSLGIVNVVGSAIAREVDAGVYNYAGPEAGIAPTKTFLSQLTLLTLLALYLSREKGKIHEELMDELELIPKKIEKILKRAAEIERLAEKHVRYGNFLFLGRRYNYPIALEGALKIKATSYIPAEGYGGGEIKHGPIEMISPDFPTVAVVPQNSVSKKMHANIEEIKARRGPVFAIATEGDKKIAALADHAFFVPKTLEPLEPILAAVPLQLFAYYSGVKRGYNVDEPRNPNKVNNY